MTTKNDLPVATYQTGPEETFLVGTKEQIEALAKTLLDAVQNTSEEKFFGVQAGVKVLKKPIMDSKGDFSIDHIVVVKNTEDKDIILYSVQNT